LLESDPARLAQVETRLTELRRLQSRYGPTIEAILAYREGAREELELIGGGEARTAAQEAEQAELAGSLETAAKRLEKARRQVAGELELAVARELAAVGLGRVSFRVAFEPLSGKTREGWEAPCAPQGRERASFWLALEWAAARRVGSVSGFAGSRRATRSSASRISRRSRPSPRPTTGSRSGCAAAAL
jgi:DNA repair protein RecN (Recombination protein N)